MNTIRFKLFLLITFIVILITSVTGGYFYFTMSNTLRSNAERELSQILNQTNNNLKAQFDTIDSTLLFFMSNPLIRDNLDKESPNFEEVHQAMQKTNIEKQLSYLLIYNYLWDAQLIKSVYIFDSKNAHYHIEHNSLTTEVSLQHNVKAYQESSLQLEATQIIPPTEKDETLYLVKNMKSEYSLEHIGTIIFAIDVQILSKNFKDITQYKGAQAILVNKNKEVLLHTDTSMLGKKINANLVEGSSTELKEVTSKGEIYLTMAKPIEKYNFISSISVSKKQVFSKFSEDLLRYIEVIALILLLFLVLTILLSAKISKPIKDLMKNINHIRKGNYATKMPSYKALELRQLSETFNKMTDEIQYLINDVYIKQLLLTKAELMSLQAQINPHFLFNVLDTISWHARAAGNKEINEIISPLASFLRANLSLSGKEKITIEEELQYIQFYLSIQHSRFKDRFESKVNVDDSSISSYYLPKLCIQPLVENAIIHGLEEKLSKGLLTINFRFYSEGIQIEILDNGAGFETNKLTTLKSEKHVSIGLYNSNKRIQLLYGENYGINITSELGKGTEVIVRIPLDKGELNNA
ncbi:histidine kinase [Paenibacillus marchantiophytorum]|uniref:Histidine kinase n=1 Tax=Paenibacillus marchantiophytorum TaxID=1619310 RepID=A0ABQ2BU54_9BACL|nr:histidine kinase [Paenibacillus marchantiophytorum]GGI46407.1 histidine kinase [Paenibacillus marchantiophytorum]